MSEYEAVVAAGLDLWRWEQPFKKHEDGRVSGYPVWFRANVLAWHRMHELKQTHAADVVATVQEAESKKRRNK